jgi:hypothetical protein
LLEKQFNHIIDFIKQNTKLYSTHNKGKDFLKERLEENLDESLRAKIRKINDTNQSNKCLIKLNEKYKLGIEKSPSIEHFKLNYVSKKIPILIEGQMEHWPAMQKWRFA